MFLKSNGVITYHSSKKMYSLVLEFVLIFIDCIRLNNQNSVNGQPAALKCIELLVLNWNYKNIIL